MNAIETLNDWSRIWSALIAESLVDGVFAASLAGLLWLAVRRFSSAQFGYLLFLLVLARLVLPVTISAPRSLAWLSPSHAVDAVKSRWFGREAFQRPATIETAPAHAPTPTVTTDAAPLQAESSSSAVMAARHASLSGHAMLMLVWAAVVALLVGRFAWVQWRWARLLQGAERLEPASLPVGLDELGRRLRLQRSVPVVVHAAVGSPAVWGLWRPRLILPAELAEHLTKSELTWVLLHELAHVRRRDLLVALVQRLAQIVYFFHPAVWLVNLTIDRQREYACDDAASAAAGCSPRECGAALVSVVERACGASPVAALGLFRSQAFLRRRIMRLVNQRRAVPLRLSWTSYALLFALAIIVLPRLNASGEPIASDLPAPRAFPIAGRQRGSGELALADESRKSSDRKADASGAPRRDATEPVSLSGRALDQKSNPVAGAEIYLASLANNEIVARTVTDEQGRYSLRNASLPIAKLSAVGEPEYCVFQVFGRKQGLGFAWNRQRWFFVHAFAENPQDAAGRLGPEGRFLPGDKIDLTFSPSARLSGQIVDDRGEPLKGIELIIWGCERLSSDRFAWSEHFTAISNALLVPALVPAEMRIRKTDDDGRFEFDDLPAECRFRIRVRTTNGPTREIWAATTDVPQPADPRAPEILLGELKLIFPRPLDVPFQILFGDTGLPAAKVLVRTYDQSGLGDKGSTDEQGRVTLRLPPGQHKIDLSPVRGTPYFSTPHIFNPVPVGFEVGSEPREKPLVFRLRPAAAVDVTVVDAETGEGIAYVDFWEQLAPNDPLSRHLPAFQSWDPETGTIWAPPPLTDADGKLRALLEEGEHRVGVGLRSIPPGYIAVETDGLVVDCRIGKPVQLKFTLRKRKLPGGDEPKEAEETIGAKTSPERLPIMDGIVLGEKNGFIELSLGADDGIRPGNVLFWYRDGTQLGRLTVVSTTPDQSIAKHTPNPKSGVEVGPPKPDDLISMRAK